MEAALIIGTAILLPPVLRAGWNRLFKKVVRWSGDTVTGLSPAEALAEALKLLRREPYGGTVMRLETDCFILKRGDWTIRRADEVQEWHRVPMLVAVNAFPKDGKTGMQVLFAACTELSFGDVTRGRFHESAANEFWLFCERLRLVENLGGRREHAPQSDALGAAYATLHLKPGVPWPDVQTAYRRACKYYHPDRLSGQNIPQQLVELAVREFKAKTEAYQLLKRHMAA